MRFILAIITIALSLWTLETARSGVDTTRFEVGQTPITAYQATDSDGMGPVVVVAHGFAGSQQMMQGYALPRARADYRVFSFEFLGHGRHPVPMSGDVTQVDGTTRLLVEQTIEVINAMEQGQPIALIGHSMATDILVRAAKGRADIGPIVLISAFSQEITATAPRALLLVSGAWEAGLRAFGKTAVQMVAPNATEGVTVQSGDITRRAVAAPFSEHVSVLQSRVARGEALAWLDQAYGRTSDVIILPTGWAILALLFGLVLSFPRVAAFIPVSSDLSPNPTLSRKRLALALITPMILTPLIAVPLEPGFLPVLVADYLGLHLLIYGLLQLVLLRHWGARLALPHWLSFVVLLLWCALFGLMLDRYAANFMPTPNRLWIILVMMVGALPYMFADAMLTVKASVAQRFCIRLSFLVSLGIAVALNFEGLFFLIMISPVMVLFYLVFGTMGLTIARRTGPTSPGLALGVVLAWALGVSFPLFQL